jgi:hypothetical protein
LKKLTAVKLAILAPALAFLAWWGWSGNFSVNSPSLFTLHDQEAFYALQAGQTSLGYAHRAVKEDPQSGLTTLSEESVLKVSFAGQPLTLKTVSETVFGADGRPVSAVFSLPFGNLGGEARAVVEGQELVCRITVSGQTHEARAALPPAGPVLVSGVVPWLAHQRNVPMGRPIGLSLLDPLSMEFKPANLIVENVTEMSDEREIYKLTLRFMGGENAEWINSEGRLIRQLNPGLGIGLNVLGESQFEVARAELDKAMAEEAPVPDGPLAALIGGFLSGEGLDVLGQALSRGGQASPWTLVPTESSPDPGTGQSQGPVGPEKSEAPEASEGPEGAGD